MKWKTAVSQIERLSTAKGRRQTGQYAIEGIRLVERAVRANKKVHFALVARKMMDAPLQRMETLLKELEAISCEVVTIPDEEMVRLTNGRSLGGVLGVLSLPQPLTLTPLLATSKQPLLLVAINIIDPGNCGAMIRTAHASGCDAFIAVGQTDPFHPKAVRTSMGSLFKLPIVQAASAEQLLGQLAELNVVTVGTAAVGKRPLQNSQFPNSGVALFMGNEYHGLPELLRCKLDINITIPMPAGVDSFSVNAATAIVLYEMNRQRA